MTGFRSQAGLNSDIKVGIICHRGTWGLQAREACTRVGLTQVTQIYTELGELEEPLNFHLVFIAEDYYSNVTGGELLDNLLSTKKISANTAIVMVGDMGDTVVHNYDSAIVLLDFLPRNFSLANFKTTVERMMASQHLFYSVLTFVASGKLAFAYKALSQLDMKKVPRELIIEYCKLQVNLAFELGKYQEVLAICNKPQLKQFDWTVWPRFKANYELGNWQYCQESMRQPDFVDLPAGPMKLFWQLRVLIEQDQHQRALQLLGTYPKQDMSLSMVRLVFALTSVSGNWQQAEEFIERKIRLSHSYPQVQATLINSQCSIYLYEFYAADSKEHKQHAIERLRAHLDSFSNHKMVSKFKYSIEVFRVYLEIAELGKTPSELEVATICQRLSEIEKNVTSPILMCRVAYAWHLLKQPERCFSMLLKADCAFSYTPFGCERLLLAMMFKQILFNVYPEQERAMVFKNIGKLHHKEQRYKLACKAYSRSLKYPGGAGQTLELLGKAMASAGMEMFAGYEAEQLAS